MSRHIQKVFISFIESYLVCVPSFKSINSSSLPRKNMVPFLKGYRDLGIH